MQLKLLELFSVLCRNYFLCFALINILSMYLTELFHAHSPIKRYLLAYVFAPLKAVCVLWILISLQDCLRLL